MGLDARMRRAIALRQAELAGQPADERDAGLWVLTLVQAAAGLPDAADESAVAGSPAAAGAGVAVSMVGGGEPGSRTQVATADGAKP